MEDLLLEMLPFDNQQRSALDLRLLEKEGENSTVVVKALDPSTVEEEKELQML